MTRAQIDPKRAREAVRFVSRALDIQVEELRQKRLAGIDSFLNEDRKPRTAMKAAYKSATKILLSTLI